MLIDPNPPKNQKIEKIIEALEIQRLPIRRNELNRINHLLEGLVQGVGFISNRKQIRKLQDELESIGFSNPRKMALIWKLRAMKAIQTPNLL